MAAPFDPSDVKKTEKMTSLEQEELVIQQKLEKVKLNIIQLSADELSKLNDRLNVIKDQYKLEQDSLENLKDKLGLLQQERDTTVNLFERRKKNIEIEKIILELKLKSGDIQKEDYRLEREKLRTSEQQIKLYEKSVGIIKSITGELGEQVVKIFTINGLMSTFKEMMSSILEVNQKFAAETGTILKFSSEFNKDLEDNRINLAKMGIGYVELANATRELYTSMSGFTSFNETTREDLAKNAATLEKLNISISVQGKVMDSLTKSFKMTATEASNTLMNVTRTAAGIGVTPKKMMEDMAAIMPKIAVYGKEAVNVFKDLEKQSKSLGIEINSLTTIVGEQWDTFEGSAKAAAGLNAALGGPYLNSIEMMNAKENERLILIKKAMDMSGMQFQYLDKWTQRNIALRIGVKDADEALKLFSKNTQQLEIDMKKEAISQDELNKAIAASVPVVQQLKQTLAMLATVVAPYVTMLKDVVSWFVQVNKELGNAPFFIIFWSSFCITFRNFLYILEKIFPITKGL